MPTFSTRRATRLVRDLYGIISTATPLPSYQDQNFEIVSGECDKFVLKIANSGEREDVLDAQHEAMARVALHSPSFGCPRVQRMLDGAALTRVKGQQHEHLVRMLSHVPGVPLAQLQTHNTETLQAVGAMLGQVDRALEGFSPSGSKRTMEWDLRFGPQTVRKYLEYVSDSSRIALLERFIERYEGEVAEVLPGLRVGVIHNDANDYNVLVDDSAPNGECSLGIIDFGDLVETHTVYEVAICAAYALLNKADPVAAAGEVIRGYHSANPLTNLELHVLFHLIAMRLCMSVAISAHKRRHDTVNDYLTISERPAWAALEVLDNVNIRDAAVAFGATPMALP